MTALGSATASETPTPRKRRRTRGELVVEYQAMLAEGLTIAEIAEQVGKAYQSVSNLLADPDGSKQRARRQRYQGVCVACGAPTDGSNGRAKAAKRCAACAELHARQEQLVWTPAAIIAGIQEWAGEHDALPPGAHEWLRKVEPSAQGNRRYPSVLAAQREFGTWAAAIEAAGFQRPSPGSRRKPEEWRSNIVAAQRKRHGFARDYGAMVKIGADLGATQVRAIAEIGGASLSEHLRRAVDLYLATVTGAERDSAERTP